jgi:Tol biopolymer transport system component
MDRRSFLFAAASAIAARAAGPALGTLAYIQSDGLWIRDLPDGEPTRIAEGAKLESPRISPSGRWIAYSRNDALYVVSRDGGKTAALGAVLYSHWLPMRDELLVSSESGLQLLTPADEFRAPIRRIPHAWLQVVFNSDGNELLYSDQVVTGRLCRLSLADPSAPPKILVSKSSAGFIPCLWSAGDEILFWEDPDFSSSIMADGLELFRVPAAGGAPQRVGIVSLVHEDSFSLSPDGDRVAISAGAGRYHWADKRIALVDLKSGQISYITGVDQTAVFPAWSPKRDWIAYSAAPRMPWGANIGGGEPAKRLLAQRRIFIGPRQITSDPDYRDEKPMWSADGSHLLCTRIDREDRLTIWLSDVENPRPIQVAGPLLAGKDAWFGYYGYIDWRALLDWQR